MDEARTSLLMSAYWKIPLQALVLIVGVLMFVFYLFTPPPMLFNPVHDAQVRASARAGEYAALEAAVRCRDRRRGARPPQQLAAASAASDAARGDAAGGVHELRTTKSSASAPTRSRIVKDVSGDASYNDVNYVFPTFVTTQLPIGLVGLIVAAILAAAMSAIVGELAALSTATVIDFYSASGPQGRRATRTCCGCRGSRRCSGDCSRRSSRSGPSELGSLIEVVNRFGSFFYGSILGVFILAIGCQARQRHRRVRRPDRRHDGDRLARDVSRSSRSSGTT